MRYDDPELLDRLASEYVLGTLHGAARRRFQRVLHESQIARDSVARWEARLSELGETLQPVEPPAYLWRSLERRIDRSQRSSVSPLQWLLGGWSAVATVLVLGLIGYLAFEPPSELEPDSRVAVVSDDNTAPLWLISVDLDSGRLTTRAVSATAAKLDRVYELWMLPAQGDPRSLGLMPVDGAEVNRQFSAALMDLLSNANGLAVSIEPPGGSPTGVPTGPVVYQAQLLPL